ncbi:MAG: hypothetical protein KBD05_01445 [Candidatus Pacebacteria bacterium]|nr:hypothetical protein [Candidatus Paceibacterota bacterium]
MEKQRESAAGYALHGVFHNANHDLTSFRADDFFPHGRISVLSMMPENSRYDCALQLLDADGKNVEDTLGPIYFELPSPKSGQPVHRLNKQGEVIDRIPYERFKTYLRSLGDVSLEQIHGIPTSFPDLEPRIFTVHITNGDK